MNKMEEAIREYQKKFIEFNSLQSEVETIEENFLLKKEKLEHMTPEFNRIRNEMLLVIREEAMKGEKT